MKKAMLLFAMCLCLVGCGNIKPEKHEIKNIMYDTINPEKVHIEYVKDGECKPIKVYTCKLKIDDENYIVGSEVHVTEEVLEQLKENGVVVVGEKGDENE